MAVAARVVGGARRTAIVAALDVTAERGGATGRDRADHAPFDAAEMSGVRLLVTLAVAAKDVGQFERRPQLHRLSRRRHVQRQSVERAHRTGDDPGRDAGVERRRRQVVVTQQHLDDANVDAALQQMGGGAATKDMHADAPVGPRRGRGRTAGGVQHGRVDPRIGRAAWNGCSPLSVILFSVFIVVIQ